jgi:hypothetical protein
MLMTLERPAYTWLDSEELDVDTRRYLADLLVGHLRDDRWHMRIDKDLVPIESPGEVPGFSSVGVGRHDPLGSSHVLSFTAPPIYELGIPKHLVALGSSEYEWWCRREVRDHLPRLDRLLRAMHGNARVFYTKLSGYGTNKQLKFRRSEVVTKEESEAALSLLAECYICILP